MSLVKGNQPKTYGLQNKPMKEAFENAKPMKPRIKSKKKR